MVQFKMPKLIILIPAIVLGLMQTAKSQLNFYERTNVKNAKLITTDEMQQLGFQMHLRHSHYYDKQGRLIKRIERHLVEGKAVQKIVAKIKYRDGGRKVVESLKSNTIFSRNRGKAIKIALSENDTTLFGIINKNIRDYEGKVGGIPTSDTTLLIKFDTLKWGVNTYLNMNEGFSQILKTVTLPDSTAKAKFVYFWNDHHGKYILYKIYIYTHDILTDGSFHKDYYKTVYGLTNLFYHDDQEHITMKNGDLIRVSWISSGSNIHNEVVHELSQHDKNGNWNHCEIKHVGSHKYVEKIFSRTIIYW